MNDEEYIPMDKALNDYYHRLGRDDYYDKYGRSKLMRFMRNNEYEKEHLEHQLGSHASPDKCDFINMDFKFPLSDKSLYDQRNKTSRDRKVFEVLQHCYVSTKPIESKHFQQFKIKLGDVFQHEDKEKLYKILWADQFYQNLNLKEAKDQDTLMKFYKKECLNILSDYMDIINNEELKNELLNYFDSSLSNHKCIMSKFEFAIRHRRNRRDNPSGNLEWKGNYQMENVSHHLENQTFNDDDDEKKENWWESYEYDDDDKTEVFKEDDIELESADDVGIEDLEFGFVHDLFDGIHCYIMHQYDFGYRRKYSDNYSIDKESNDESIISSSDARFENDKFTVSTGSSAKYKHQTATDALYKSFQPPIRESSLREYSYTNGFDTEAMEMDVQDRDQSNIYRSMGNETFTHVATFLSEIASMYLTIHC